MNNLFSRCRVLLVREGGSRRSVCRRSIERRRRRRRGLPPLRRTHVLRATVWNTVPSRVASHRGMLTRGSLSLSLSLSLWWQRLRLGELHGFVSCAARRGGGARMRPRRVKAGEWQGRWVRLRAPRSTPRSLLPLLAPPPPALFVARAAMVTTRSTSSRPLRCLGGDGCDSRCAVLVVCLRLPRLPWTRGFFISRPRARETK